jgi:hypothetical protein
MFLLNIVWRYEKLASFKKMISGFSDLRDFIEPEKSIRNVQI